jgi:UDP-N-acetylmuramate--alanine ligase
VTVLRYHFSGIAGAGMGPLACLMRVRGHQVQGSDRAFDQGKKQDIAAQLRGAGIELAPQDGTAITAAINRLIYSAAVEADTPELRAGRALGLPCLPRPQLLAEVVNTAAPGVAISGTSGKSTIVGMLGWLLHEGGVKATVLGGAAFVGEGAGGCFVAGPAGGPAVAEACESDGTLVGYHPAVGVIHNVSRDHDELSALRPQFTAFARNCGRLLVGADCPEAAALGRRFKAATYGVTQDADARLRVTSVGPRRARGVLRHGGRDLTLDIPQPGLHNLENATAAALVALEIGMDADTVVGLLARFPGVARRFELVGTTARDIHVVDDYAHNGEKIRAAISTAQAGSARVVAVFQPHGFGPARFLRGELREMIPTLLRPQDRFCYAEIFYAGGTVARDISSRMLADDLPAALNCGYARDHEAARQWVVNEAEPGDTVLIMGARDPDLPRLARAVLKSL